MFPRKRSVTVRALSWCDIDTHGIGWTSLLVESAASGNTDFASFRTGDASDVEVPVRVKRSVEKTYVRWHATQPYTGPGSERPYRFRK